MDGARPAPSTAARTGTRGVTRHGTAARRGHGSVEGTGQRGGDTASGRTRVPGGQSHVSSHGAEKGARRGGVCCEGFTRWEGGGVPVGAEMAARWELRPGAGMQPGREGPPPPQPGRASSHGVLKSFPFVETKILCEEEKDKKASETVEGEYSHSCRDGNEVLVPGRGPKPELCPSCGHQPVPGRERSKLSEGLKIMAF